jgi:hypothetical protein
MVAGNINQARRPVDRLQRRFTFGFGFSLCGSSSMIPHTSARNRIINASSTAENAIPESIRATREFLIRDPLAAEKIAQDGYVGGFRPPGEGAVDMG